jgi:hypothetical protein
MALNSLGAASLVGVAPDMTVLFSTGPVDPLLISGKMVEGVRISYFEGAVEAGKKFGRMK